jgi:hypothetical protein
MIALFVLLGWRIVMAGCALSCVAAPAGVALRQLHARFGRARRLFVKLEPVHK